MADPVLITGATGLLGSWVVRHWPRTEPPLHVVRREDADLLAPGAAAALVRSVRPGAVVHLAWVASGTPGYRGSADNDRWVAASLELHAACAELGVPLWATGTVVDDEPDPADAYTAAKVALRRELEPAIAAGTIGWLRPAYVFDEAAGRPAVVAAALAARAEGAPVTLQTPDIAHDFVHASDVGAAVVAAVRNGCTGYLPVGSGRVRRVADLVTALGVAWRRGADAPAVSHTEAPAAIGWLHDLGWHPTTTEEFFADD